MKLIGFEAIEGGIILHCPSGTRKVCPVSDDAEKVASAIGALVMETMASDGEPLARLEDMEVELAAELADEEDDDELEDEEEEEDRPRRRRRRKTGRRRRSAGSALGGIDPKMRRGESGHDYVDRVGREAGLSAIKLLWKGLQRASGTRPTED